MAGGSKKALALLEVFLLLSVSPISAHRASEVETMVESLGGTHSSLGGHELVREELERAFQEDMHGSDLVGATNATHGFIGEFWASCDKRKQLFEERSTLVKQRYDKAMENGHIDAAEATWVILKARHAAKTLENAQKKGCDWVTKGSGQVNLSPMEALLARTSSKQLCVGAAKQQLDAARGKDVRTQRRAFLDAMGTLLSNTPECKKVESEEPSDEAIASELDRTDKLEDEEEEALEMAYEAGQFEKAKLQKLRDQKAVVLMDKSPDPSAKASWLESAGGNSLYLTTESDFGEVISKVITFVVPVIMWIIECQVLFDVIVMVLGMILCIFKQITVSIVSLFGGSSGDFVFNECTKFWLGAMWKKEKQQEQSGTAVEETSDAVEETSDSGLGVAVCAARIMTVAAEAK